MEENAKKSEKDSGTNTVTFNNNAATVIISNTTAYTKIM